MLHSFQCTGPVPIGRGAQFGMSLSQGAVACDSCRQPGYEATLSGCHIVANSAAKIHRPDFQTKPEDGLPRPTLGLWRVSPCSFSQPHGLRPALRKGSAPGIEPRPSRQGATNWCNQCLLFFKYSSATAVTAGAAGHLPNPARMRRRLLWRIGTIGPGSRTCARSPPPSATH